MIEYQRVVNHLKKNGYSEQENISDYWFYRHENCKRIVDKRFPSYSQIFELQVRWRSTIGRVCVEALKSHIEQRREKARLESSIRYKLSDFSFVFAKLDLNDFTFHFKEREYNVKAVAEAFPTSQIKGWHDLRGIPLDGICLTDCKLIGLNFSNASFVGANFQQVQLVNCNFISANFDNSRFVMIRHDQETALGGISLKASFVNAVEISDQVVRNPMRITELGYCELIKYLLDTLVWKKNPVRNRGKWTRFQLVDVRGLNDPLLRYQAEYINWSQSLLGKIDGFSELPMSERISLLGSIVFTQYWRSAIVLAIFSAVINSVFAISYIAFSSHFKGLSGGFLESLYFSVVTFTTLGYGDVTPNDDLGRILVILEVIIGYVTLGSFLFILGQKVSQRY
jgi:hypothetical protein